MRACCVCRLLKAVLKSWKQGAEQGLDMTYELMDVLHDLGTIQAELSTCALWPHHPAHVR
jgi:hypothetical protein